MRAALRLVPLVNSAVGIGTHVSSSHKHKGTLVDGSDHLNY